MRQNECLKPGVPAQVDGIDLVSQCVSRAVGNVVLRLSLCRIFAQSYTTKLSQELSPNIEKSMSQFSQAGVAGWPFSMTSRGMELALTRAYFLG